MMSAVIGSSIVRAMIMSFRQRGGAASIVDEPFEQRDGGGQFVLLPR
jgi:hypothetical protein